LKLLLDENLPHALRRENPQHEMFTTANMGWAGVRNGELLRLAATAHFDAFITADLGFIHQHNVAALPIAVVDLARGDTSLRRLVESMPRLLAALLSLKPNTLVVVAEP